VLLSLTRLGWEALASKSSRVVIQAGCALGRLAKEPSVRYSLLQRRKSMLPPPPPSPSTPTSIHTHATPAQVPFFVRASPIWFVMILAAPSGSTSIKCQDQFRCEARAALLSLLAAAAQESAGISCLLSPPPPLIYPPDSSPSLLLLHTNTQISMHAVSAPPPPSLYPPPPPFPVCARTLKYFACIDHMSVHTQDYIQVSM